MILILTADTVHALRHLLSVCLWLVVHVGEGESLSLSLSLSPLSLSSILLLIIIIYKILYNIIITLLFLPPSVLMLHTVQVHFYFYVPSSVVVGGRYIVGCL